MIAFHRFTWAGPAVVLASLAAVRAAAQEVPTFSTGVEQVTVDAVVLDRDGEPVAGLGPEDFELRDEGELRDILSFQALDVSAGLAPAAPASRSVASNVDSPPERMVAVLWDDGHLSPAFAERARRALRPWLAERLAQGERVVLASAGGAWHVAEDARLAEALLGVLDRLKGERPPPDDPLWTNAREAALSARVRLTATLRALRHLADVLAVGRGRKPIVLVSEGFLQDPDLRREFAQVTRAAQRANAVLSFLDPAGLRALRERGAVSPPLPGPADQALFYASGLAGQSGSEGLAHDTGGLVPRTNDLASGLEQILRESHTHYLLGFAPAPGAETGAFRRLSLRVHRPGLKVRARQGYTVSGERPREPGEELRRTLDAPFDVPGQPMRVVAWVLEPRSPQLSRVALGIGVARPSGMDDPGAEPRRVDLVVEVHGGQRRWRQDRELVFQPQAGSAQSDGDAWGLAILGLELPAGTFRVRAVTSEESGSVSGAVSHIFEVPRADAWHVSTPILSSSLLVGPGGRTPVPTMSREFEVGRTLYGQFSVYATPGKPESARDRLSGRWSLRRTEAADPERSGPLTLTPAAEDAVSCLFSLSLSGLPAGDYVLTLRVRDGREERELENVETLTLVTAPGGVESRAPPATPEPTHAVEPRGLQFTLKPPSYDRCSGARPVPRWMNLLQVTIMRTASPT